MSRQVSLLRNTVPTGVTNPFGHVRRNQRSRCQNRSGHIHRNVGHDPGITGHVGPEYSLEQATILMQDSHLKPATAFVDLGYRGVDADNPQVRIGMRPANPS